MLEHVPAAIAAFAATNVEDLLVLAVLAARPGLRPAQLVAGQLAGFAAVLAVSVAAAAGLLALPRELTGVLGLVPIALGLRGLWRLRRGEDDDEVPPAAVLGTAGVAAVALANGVDDVAVFAPLFAALGWSGTALAAGVFAVLAVALCAAALRLGSRPAVVRAVDRAGDVTVPVVLVALGVYVVLESGLAG